MRKDCPPATASCSQHRSPGLTPALSEERLLGKHRGICGLASLHLPKLPSSTAPALPLLFCHQWLVLCVLLPWKEGG